MTAASINIQELLNQKKLSRFQWLIFIMTFLVAFFDGYDTAVIGYIAPSLLGEWGINRNELAPVLSAALFGLAVGAISSGPIADYIGRKIPLVLSVILFAGGSLVSAQATSLSSLEIWRFITGIGLGAAMPNAVTLLSEYCPEKKRASIVNGMFCGFPLGAALGGFIAAYLIPEFGWRSTFIFGGVFPLVLGIVMLFTVPESLRFLLAKKKPRDVLQRAVARIDPIAKTAQSFYFPGLAKQEKQGISIVLSKHFIVGSLLLWICYFMGLVIFYGVINWMPVLLSQTTIDAGTAKRVVGLFALGGLGTIVGGYLMDRYNRNILNAILALLTSIFIALMGVSLSWGLVPLLTVIIVAGIVMNTLQASLPTLAALFYPTEGRTTGVSWMMGIGRFGGVAGSFLVAELVQRNVELANIFLVLSIPALIMFMCLLLKQFIYRT